MASTARKNVTTACKACRDSKTKCDGGAPQCANCVKKGRLCQYEAKEDKRRVSFRPTLGILRRRIDDLENALIGAGTTSPPMNDDDLNVANKVLESVGLPQLVPHSPEPRDTSTNVNTDQAHVPLNLEHPSAEVEAGQSQLDLQVAGANNALASVGPDGNTGFDDGMSFADWSYASWDDNLSPDWPWAGLFATDLEIPQSLIPNPATAQEASSSSGTATLAATHDGGREDEVDLDLVNQISSRFGSLHLAPDGKLRYFGTPANTHLFGSKGISSSHATLSSIKLDGPRILRNAGLDQSVDRAFENHLLQLFFAWHNSCHPVVDASMYWPLREQRGKSEEDSSFYSEVLTNAMCALGASYEARYHAELVTFPRPLAEFFADRAKALLEIELDSPCVSTVQALLLLSSHELGSERLARSWLYGGMAMRLCFDLGLHIDTDPYVQQGIMSIAGSQTRQLVFWSCYIINYRASFSLGRPFTLDDSEITVRKPSGTFKPSIDVWRPYPMDVTDKFYLDTAQSEGQPDLIGTITEQRIKLSRMVEPIARALYGNTNITSGPLQEMSEKATAALFNWKDTLPSVLDMPEKASATVVPQLLVLHLEYHYMQILIHRPWTSRRLQPSPSRGRGYRHARQTCINSACETARILSIFEGCFGCRRLNVETLQVLPSTALILMFAIVSASNNDSTQDTIVTHLNTILRALDELSSTYLCAREYLDNLLQIQRRWHSIYGQQKTKRNGENGQDASDSSRQKKRRTIASV